jgi:protein-S-isoprenylcysteine O-methyltransferase Ste14
MRWTQIVLASALAFYLGAFGICMAAVRSRTGANPMGHEGGHHLAALLNKAATALLFLTALACIVDAQSAAWFGYIAFLDHPIARGLGVAALVVAGVLIVWGEVSLGRSFRVALPERRQPLVTHGIYRFIRNPLALSVDLFALGILLLAPSLAALGTLALNVAAYEWKIRIEETYLLQEHAGAYEAYCAQAGRYLPRLIRRNP